jgi:hypothetical protein
MKIKSTRHHNISVFSFTLVASLMFAPVCFASRTPVTNFKLFPREEEPAKKAKSKTFSSRNNSSVKIYPDVIKRSMHVTAKENEGKAIDFFVFDLQGTLMQNYKMKAKDQIKIQGLARGIYIYRVFCGDEETASGNFEIR